MKVQTSRFGEVEVADDRVIEFPQGLLGFGERSRYCLLRPSEEGCFLWLQSVDDAGLAFVVTDPALFLEGYEVPIRSEQAESLRLRDLSDAQVLVIVNKVGGVLTGNLQGPLVVNTVGMIGEQFVLADKRWTTRHELMRLGQGPVEEPLKASA